MTAQSRHPAVVSIAADAASIPDVRCNWTALADYAINYQINAFTSRDSILPKLLSDLHKNIITVFNENGVQIMTPSYERDPDVPKIGPVEWTGELVRVE